MRFRANQIAASHHVALCVYTTVTDEQIKLGSESAGKCGKGRMIADPIIRNSEFAGWLENGNTVNLRNFENFTQR